MHANGMRRCSRKQSTHHMRFGAGLTSVLVAVAIAGLVQGSASAQKPSLTIQVDQPTAKVSPMFYGLMTEEINFSYDGGLYPELVRDRAISDARHAIERWPMVAEGDAEVEISIDSTQGPSQALTSSLKVHVKNAKPGAAAGVQNSGYWGMAVRPNWTYTGSFYAKADTAGFPITVALVNDQTGEKAAVATVNGVGTEWKRYEFTMKTGNVAASANNHLALTTTKPGTIWFNLISLFPPTYHNRPYGNRIDLMEKMAAMRPQFLRFPGGNYLEGDHIADRFQWKQTIGPWVNRPTHPSPWRYRSSDGMGLLEFLLWCEDLKMEPVLAVYAGYSLRQEHVDPGPALEPYIQDALDEIEYVTGDANTKWGAQRVKDGHAAPFPLRYVEIGNEDWFDKSGSYEGRYAQFYKEIKQRYPQLQLIATMPLKNMKPDVQDDHFYMSAEKAYSDATHYDKADRNGPKIFVGEWATREGDPAPNLQAALADSAWMTGMERNGDLIIMSCYAPLFVNVNPGGMQWSTDLIGYDALNSFGSPSYYAQAMFANHIGTEIVPAALSDAGARVYASATRDEAQHKVIVKVVNGNSEAKELNITLTGLKDVKRSAKLITLSGKSPNATNSIANPTAIVPVEKVVQVAGPVFKQAFVPYSVNVLEVNY